MITSRDKKSGFTLMEMIAVVVILGIISSIAYMNMHRERRKGELKGARANVQMIVAAQKLYYLDFHCYRWTPGTPWTNFYLGLKIKDGYFNNYVVAGSGGTFIVSVDGGNAVYTFNDQGVLTGCVGTDCV